MDLGMMLLNSGMGSAMQLSVAEIQRLQMESVQLAQAQMEDILRRQAAGLAQPPQALPPLLEPKRASG